MLNFHDGHSLTHLLLSEAYLSCCIHDFLGMFLQTCNLALDRVHADASCSKGYLCCDAQLAAALAQPTFQVQVSSTNCMQDRYHFFKTGNAHLSEVINDRLLPLAGPLPAWLC